jgi:hypothetical protein
MAREIVSGLQPTNKPRRNNAQIRIHTYFIWRVILQYLSTFRCGWFVHFLATSNAQYVTNRSFDLRIWHPVLCINARKLFLNSSLICIPEPTAW